MMRANAARLALAATALLLGAAAARALEPTLPGVPQDALQAAGPQASHVIGLWRLMLGLCTAFFAAILLVLGIALARAPRSRADTPPDLAMLQRPERSSTRRVLAGVAASIVGLLVLIAASVGTDRALGALALRDAVHIELTANQWWWQAVYTDEDVSRRFETANELHIPVGKPVLVTLKSSDVIHSFWVPNLAGKKDLIPGRTATLALRADKPGRYRGQCAEFCGVQHAGMALLVVAEPADAYSAWAEQQRKPAPDPSDATLARGRQLFTSTTCAMCHNVTGTDATGRKAPDLTHVGSRETLAAGTLPNNPASLAGWIANPQAHKPGVNMPGHAFSGDDLQALVAWLESLK